MRLKLSPWEWLRAALVLVGTVVAVTFVGLRVVAMTPNGGDVAVWVSVHEWMSRGARLYVDVWDHKDMGFFYLNHPAFAAWGISGLYVMALLYVVLFSTGVAYLAAPSGTLRLRVVTGLAAAALFVSSPAYLATYTEAAAVSLIVLGIALWFRFPLIAGVIFSLAASVKVASIAVWVAMAIVLGLRLVVQWKASCSRLAWRTLSRNLLGFAIGGAGILVLATASGVLGGWIESIRFNRQYASSRGFVSPLDGLAPAQQFLQSALVDILRTPTTTLIFGSVTLAGCVILAVVLTYGGRDRTTDTAASPSPAILMLVAGAVSAFVVTLSQRPAFHHWQFFFGLLVALLVVLATSAYRRPTSSSLVRVVVLAVTVSPLVVAVFMESGLRPASLSKGAENVLELNASAQAAEVLRALPSNSSLAVLGTNRWRVSYEDLPAGSQLGCRHFFQFSWITLRYGDEIANCLLSGPDVVLVEVENPVEALSWGDASFRDRVASQLDQTMILCDSDLEFHDVWTRIEGLCGELTSVGKG